MLAVALGFGYIHITCLSPVTSSSLLQFTLLGHSVLPFFLKDTLLIPGDSCVLTHHKSSASPTYTQTTIYLWFPEVVQLLAGLISP